jgi:iron complex outermembrane receptor protein
LFPSANLSFVPSELLKWENRHGLHFAKLRFAYSETASDDAPYQLEKAFYTGSFAGQPTASTEGTIRPLDLRPQRSRGYEAGMNLGAFRDRLQVRCYLVLISAAITSC